MKNYLVKAKESSPFLLIQKRHTSKSDSYSRIQFPDVCEESCMEISCTCPLVAAVKQRYRPLFNSSHDTKKGCESQVVARNALSDKSEPAIVIATQNYQQRHCCCMILSFSSYISKKPLRILIQHPHNVALPPRPPFLEEPRLCESSQPSKYLPIHPPMANGLQIAFTGLTG